MKADNILLSVRLWAGIDDIYGAILAHSFIAGLTDGALEREAFRFYVVQDAHHLREYFFADFGMSEQEVAATPMAPTNLAYTSYLLASVYGGSFPDALGAVLPCYWIYWEVGKALLERGSPNPLYRRWIETYGGEEFAAVVRAVLELTDRLGPRLGPEEEAPMLERFRTTSRYEWMFWEMGYRQERWPV